jgi:hypothetical protein
MPMNRAILLAFLLVPIVTATTFATTLNVPGDYLRIQWALDAAQAGDTIMVESGTYYERLMWPSTQGINLFSKKGAELTIIDAGARESACAIYTGVDTTTIIRGFTFTNGDVGGA